MNQNYWEQYYNYWDGFVKQWFTGRESNPPRDEIATAWCSQVDALDIDVLPTPYLGTPSEGVDAVFLNMNPGLSEIGKRGTYKGISLDDTQRYSLMAQMGSSVPRGWLIQQFRDEAQESYRSFINKWSCLNPKLRDYEPQVCGVDWWQGIDSSQVGGRVAWLRRIYNKNDMCPSRVFAVELCPFHSRRFTIRKIDNYLVSFIKEHVIDPASVAVQENELLFAVGVGKKVAMVLEKIGARMEHEWSYRNQIPGWPLNRQREPTVRIYRLYALTGNNGREVRYLITWAQANSNPPPAPHFAIVEEAIRRFCQQM